MAAYYNEIDPFAAQWLRELIKAGHIAPGEVDERSILEVQPDDLRGFTQCHFFAGIGVWSYALRLAGFPDDRPAWSGSCPCQPFSAAGKQEGHADERHLAPVWLRLIRECRPSVVFGEQVSAAVGMGWLDALFIQLEQADYACGAAVFPAASVGAPHIRERLYFVADAGCGTSERNTGGVSTTQAERGCEGEQHGDLPLGYSNGGPTGGLADAGHEQPPRRDDSAEGLQHRKRGDARGEPSPCSGQPDRMGDSESGGCGERGDAPLQGSSGHPDGAEQPFIVGDSEREGMEGFERHGDRGSEPGRLDQEARGPTPTAGFWADAIWLPCRDGKARPTQSWPFEVDDGIAGSLGFVRDGDRAFLSPLIEKSVNRVGRLRCYGNAINAPQAEAFIRAYIECRA